VLKVAHHGSASATSHDFLDAATPRYAVISVGRRNVYRHPRIEVLQRLQNHNVRTYRTDLNGATTFFLDGKNVSVQVPRHP
jgi:competence protein ComEC